MPIKLPIQIDGEQALDRLISKIEKVYQATDRMTGSNSKLKSSASSTASSLDKQTQSSSNLNAANKKTVASIESVVASLQKIKAASKGGVYNIANISRGEQELRKMTLQLRGYTAQAINANKATMAWALGTDKATNAIAKKTMATFEEVTAQKAVIQSQRLVNQSINQYIANRAKLQTLGSSSTIQFNAKLIEQEAALKRVSMQAQAAAINLTKLSFAQKQSLAISSGAASAWKPPSTGASSGGGGALAGAGASSTARAGLSAIGVAGFATYGLAAGAGYVGVRESVDAIKKGADLDYIVKYGIALDAVTDGTLEFTDAMKQEQGEITSSLRSMDKSRRSTIELAEGLREFKKAGVDTADALRDLPTLSAFAEVSDMAVSQAVGQVIGVTNAFKEFGSSYADIADRTFVAASLAPVSSQEMATQLSYVTELGSVAKLSDAEVLALLTTVNKFGIKGSKAGTAVRTAMMRLMTDTSRVNEKLKEFGADPFSAFDENGKAKSASETLKDFSKSLEGLNDEQAANIMRIAFGLRAMKGGANLVKDIGNNFDYFHKKILDSKGSLEAMQSMLNNTGKGRIEQAGVAWNDFKQSLVDTDAVKNSFKSIADGLNTMTKGVENIGKMRRNNAFFDVLMDVSRFKIPDIGSLKKLSGLDKINNEKLTVEIDADIDTSEVEAAEKEFEKHKSTLSNVVDVFKNLNSEAKQYSGWVYDISGVELGKEEIASMAEYLNKINASMINPGETTDSKWLDDLTAKMQRFVLLADEANASSTGLRNKNAQIVVDLAWDATGMNDLISKTEEIDRQIEYLNKTKGLTGLELAMAKSAFEVEKETKRIDIALKMLLNDAVLPIVNTKFPPAFTGLLDNFSNEIDVVSNKLDQLTGKRFKLQLSTKGLSVGQVPQRLLDMMKRRDEYAKKQKELAKLQFEANNTGKSSGVRGGGGGGTAIANDYDRAVESVQSLKKELEYLQSIEGGKDIGKQIAFDVDKTVAGYKGLTDAQRESIAQQQTELRLAIENSKTKAKVNQEQLDFERQLMALRAKQGVSSGSQQLIDIQSAAEKAADGLFFYTDAEKQAYIASKASNEAQLKREQGLLSFANKMRDIGAEVSKIDQQLKASNLLELNDINFKIEAESFVDQNMPGLEGADRTQKIDQLSQELAVIDQQKMLLEQHNQLLQQQVNLDNAGYQMVMLGNEAFMERLNMARELGTISLQQYDKLKQDAVGNPLTSFIQGIKASRSEMMSLNQAVEKTGQLATEHLANGLGAAIWDASQGTKSLGDSFKDMARAFIQAMIQMIAKQIVFITLQMASKALSYGLLGDGGAVASGYANGGSIQGYDTGGSIVGWSPNSKADNILIAATAGEFMQPVSAVEYYGDKFMEDVRTRRFPKPQQYATGGSIGGTATSSAAVGYMPPVNNINVDTPQQEVNMNVVNVVDKNLFTDYIDSPDGEQVLTNYISRNRSSIKQMIG